MILPTANQKRNDVKLDSYGQFHMDWVGYADDLVIVLKISLVFNVD